MTHKLATAAASAATLGLAAGAWYYAAMWPASQLFGRTLIAPPLAPGAPAQAALTFDDGPNPAATPQLLEVLARHNVRATFFVIGDYVRREPALTRAILAAGHVLGNHTMHHPRLAFQTAARIRTELTSATAAIEDITGAPVRLFRPPFGGRRPAVLHIARELNLTPVLWNVSGEDWKPLGPDRIYDRLATGLARQLRRRRAANLLLHDGSHLDPQANRLDTLHAVDRLLTTHATTRFVTLDARSPQPAPHPAAEPTA